MTWATSSNWAIRFIRNLHEADREVHTGETETRMRDGKKTLPRLLVLTPGTLEKNDSPALLACLEAICECGSLGVILREKRLPDRSYLSLLQEVLALQKARSNELWVGAHDRVHLGILAGTDGVHLAGRSLAPRRVRQLLEADPIKLNPHLGFSCHAQDDPKTLGALDYLFYSPVHATASKPGAEGLGWDSFERFAQDCKPMVYALGGIKPLDAEALFAHGGYGLCVLSGILGVTKGTETHSSCPRLPAPKLASERTKRYLEAIRASLPPSP